MLALVVNWARTPPLAREDEPWPTDASRSRTTTRSTPASRSSRATDSPMTPPPMTATSTVSGTPPGPSGDRGQPGLGRGGQALGQADEADAEQQVDDLDQPVQGAGQQAGLGEPDDEHKQAPDGGHGDQAGLHAGPGGQDGLGPQGEHEQDPEQLVQVDQAGGVAGPEQDAEGELDQPDDADAHLDGGDGGSHGCCSFPQASQPGRTRPDS